MTQEKSLLTINEAAKILGVTPLTLRNWDKQGKLTALRHPMNNYRVYKRSDVEKLIQGIQEGSVPERFAPRLRRSSKKSLDVKHV